MTAALATGAFQQFPLMVMLAFAVIAHWGICLASYLLT
jgi:hypothetical protein